MRDIKKVLPAVLALLILASAAAWAKPGPVVVTFMERFEWHSDVRSVDPTLLVGPDSTPGTADDVVVYDDVIYLYSLLSAYRELDKNVSGNIFYMNKFDFDDGEPVTHVGGVSITHKLTGKWQMTYSYSHSSNPERNELWPSDYYTESTGDRLSFAVAYKWNPNEKVKPRYSLRSTFGTSTDFSSGRTISEKITIRDNISKRLSYDASYQFDWGLNIYDSYSTTLPDPDSRYDSIHMANQWQLNFTYKISKTKRVILGYALFNFMYPAAPTAKYDIYDYRAPDDDVIRLSFFSTM